jgi:hypothetical protein
MQFLACERMTGISPHTIKESTMRSSRTLVWFFILAAGVFSAFAQVDDSPQLPDQYAEAVLQVEGMI